MIFFSSSSAYTVCTVYIHRKRLFQINAGNSYFSNEIHICMKGRIRRAGALLFLKSVVLFIQKKFYCWTILRTMFHCLQQCRFHFRTTANVRVCEGGVGGGLSGGLPPSSPPPRRRRWVIRRSPPPPHPSTWFSIKQNGRRGSPVPPAYKGGRPVPETPVVPGPANNEPAPG